jgi:hypothetical protein
MAYIFGKKYSKKELLRRVGDMSQIAGVTPVELVNGSERGIRTLEFNNGSGLSFNVLTDRGMDIFEAKYNGSSLCWHSPAGATAPAFFDRHDFGWLWSFAGGLVVTCGLEQAGSPNIDDEEELGLHGRISNIPAKNVSFGTDWEDDDYIIWASGDVREASLFGPNLLLRRSIHSRLGQNRLWIKDEVENQGFEESPLMFLYHCNMGFPVVDEGSELLGLIDDCQPRDREAQKGRDTYDRFEAPTEDYAEQCFFLDLDVDHKGFVDVALVNRQFNNNQGIGVYLRYPKKELPRYTQWKMVGEGAYVVGMEPGNCLPEGRSSARKKGALQTLLPGEKVTFHLEIGVLADNNDIRAFEARLKGING